MNSDSRGFTLIEVVVVIALLLVLAAISAPNLATMMRHADFRADVRTVISAIKTTRMEAVKRNQLCTITFSTDAAGADIYTVYVDNDEDLRVTAGVDIVLIDGAFEDAVINNNSLADNADGDPSNAFTGRGMPVNDAGGFGGGTIELRGSTNPGEMAKDVVLNTVGRLRIE